MITFINKDGKDLSYEGISEFFQTKRSSRNELLGSYLTEPDDNGNIKASVVLTKVDEKIKSYELFLNNLKNLRVEISRLAADEEAKKLQGTIDDMSIERAQALLEKLQSKLSV